MKRILSCVIVASLLLASGGADVGSAAAAEFEGKAEPIVRIAPLGEAPLSALEPAAGLAPMPVGLEAAALELAPQPELAALKDAVAARPASPAAAVARLAASPAVATMTSQDARVGVAQRVEAGNALFDRARSLKDAAASAFGSFFAKPSQTYAKWGLGKPRDGKPAKDRAGSEVPAGLDAAAIEPYVALRPEGEGFGVLARRVAENPMIAKLRDARLYAAEAVIGEDGRPAGWNLQFSGFASRWDKFRNRLTRVSVSVGSKGADYRRSAWRPDFFGTRKVKALSHPDGMATLEQALARAARDYPEMRVLSAEPVNEVDGGWISSGMIGDYGKQVSWDVPVWKITGVSRENSAIPMVVNYLAKTLAIRTTLFEQSAQAAEVLAPETPVWARFRLSLEPPHNRTAQQLDAIRDRVIREFHGEQWGPLDLGSDLSESHSWRMKLTAGNFVALKKLMYAYNVDPTFEYAAREVQAAPPGHAQLKDRAGSAVVGSDRDVVLVDLWDTGSDEAALDAKIASLETRFGFQRDYSFDPERQGSGVVTIRGSIAKEKRPDLAVQGEVLAVWPSVGREVVTTPYVKPASESVFRRAVRAVYAKAPALGLLGALPPALLIIGALAGPVFVAIPLLHVSGALGSAILLGGITAPLMTGTFKALGIPARIRLGVPQLFLALGGATLIMMGHHYLLPGLYAILGAYFGYKAFRAFSESKSPNEHPIDRFVNSLEANALFNALGYQLMALGWALTHPTLSLLTFMASTIVLATLQAPKRSVFDPKETAGSAVAPRDRVFRWAEPYPASGGVDRFASFADVAAHASNIPAIANLREATLIEARAELDQAGNPVSWELGFAGYASRWSRFFNRRTRVRVTAAREAASYRTGIEKAGFFGSRKLKALYQKGGSATLAQAVAKAAREYPEMILETAEPAVEEDGYYDSGMNWDLPGQGYVSWDAPVWRFGGRSRTSPWITMTASYSADKLLLRKMDAENPGRQEPEILAPETPAWVRLSLVLDPPHTRTTAQLDKIRERVLRDFNALQWQEMNLAGDSGESHSWRMKVSATDYLRLRKTWAGYHAIPALEYTESGLPPGDTTASGAKDRAGSLAPFLGAGETLRRLGVPAGYEVTAVLAAACAVLLAIYLAVAIRDDRAWRRAKRAAYARELAAVPGLVRVDLRTHPGIGDLNFPTLTTDVIIRFETLEQIRAARRILPPGRREIDVREWDIVHYVLDRSGSNPVH